MKTILKNETFCAEINHKGAELISFKKIEKEFIWNGNSAFWGKHSPVLFPIVGTLKNNTFQYEQQNYNLSRHGFARDMNFKVILETENSVVFSLKSTPETLKNYPFKFELQLEYTLKNNCLSISYKILNTQNEEMFFCIGGHPAFSLPNEFKNYSLLFKDDESLNYFLLDDGLLTHKWENIKLIENKLNLDYKLFEKDALVIKKMKSKSITILEKNKEILQFNFKDFPNFGIWTVVNAPFICLEPWLGYADTVNCSGKLSEKEGVIKLNGNSKFEAQFSIEILET